MLKKRKEELEAEVSIAMIEKNFDICSDLQPELDRINAEITQRLGLGLSLRDSVAVFL
jgi:hypothetical protein